MTTDEPKDKTTEGEAKAEDQEKAEKQTLYALAEEYAGTNETLLALIGDTKGSASTLTRTVRGYHEQEDDDVTMRTVRGYHEQEDDDVTMRTVRGYHEQEDDDVTMRGRTRGPARHTDVVSARGTDIYNLTFQGGESAVLSVLGDGDTDLDLYVYDENGTGYAAIRTIPIKPIAVGGHAGRERSASPRSRISVVCITPTRCSPTELLRYVVALSVRTASGRPARSAHCHELRTLAPLGFAHGAPPFLAPMNVPSMKHSRRSRPPRSCKSSARACRTSYQRAIPHPALKAPMAGLIRGKAVW